MPRVGEPVAGDGDEQAIAERRPGAHRDEGVHVRAAVPEGRPGAGVELPARPRHHRQGEREQQPGSRRHAQRHGEERRGEADAELQSKLTPLAIPRRLIRPGQLLNRAVPFGQLGAVAGLANGLDQALRRRAGRVVGHRRRAGHQVHVGAVHPRRALQRPLHAGAACGAGHALHRDGELTRTWWDGRGHGAGASRYGCTVAR